MKDEYNKALIVRVDFPPQDTNSNTGIHYCPKRFPEGEKCE